MTDDKKPPTDWEAIEREYRAGQLSVMQIGRMFGVSHTAINKRAKKEGWIRDLREQVAARAAAQLAVVEVPSDTASPSIKATIETAAARTVQIVREHRSDIGRARSIARRLFDELDLVTMNREEIEELIEEETKGDETQGRRNMMLKAVSLPSRAAAINHLSTSLKNLVGLERQAFGLGDEGAPNEGKSTGPTMSPDMNPLDLAAQYVALIKGDDSR